MKWLFLFLFFFASQYPMICLEMVSERRTLICPQVMKPVQYCFASSFTFRPISGLSENVLVDALHRVQKCTVTHKRTYFFKRYKKYNVLHRFTDAPFWTIDCKPPFPVCLTSLFFFPSSGQFYIFKQINKVISENGMFQSFWD